MTATLNWVRMQSIGCFVASNADTGEVLARPINSDGSMSDSEGEECSIDPTDADFETIKAVAEGRSEDTAWHPSADCKCNYCRGLVARCAECGQDFKPVSETDKLCARCYVEAKS